MEVLFRLSLPSAREPNGRTLRSYRIMDYRFRGNTLCTEGKRRRDEQEKERKLSRVACISTALARRIIVANTRASPHVGASRFASRGSTARRPAIVARLIVSSQAVIEILKSVAAVVAQRLCSSSSSSSFPPAVSLPTRVPARHRGRERVHALGYLALARNN